MKLSSKEKKRIYTRYGTWAVVTGGSSGIGLELATQLASAGFNLVLNSRQIEKLQAVADQLHQLYGVEIRPVAADMATGEGSAKLIAATEGLPVGLLVVSAGYGTSGKLLTNALREEVEMLRVNCEALLVLTHHFSQQFVAQRRGGIILLSSMVAFQGVPFAANYAATKAYVQSLAEALAVELKPYQVDVLAAAPGPVASGFGQRADMQMAMTLKPEQVGVPILKALGRKTTVLPGLLTKLLVYSLRTVPRWGKVLIMEKVMGGMTAHQQKKTVDR